MPFFGVNNLACECINQVCTGLVVGCYSKS